MLHESERARFCPARKGSQAPSCREGFVVDPTALSPLRFHSSPQRVGRIRTNQGFFAASWSLPGFDWLEPTIDPRAPCISAALLTRRHVAIFVEFTRQTGYRHPYLDAAFSNYAALLADLGKSQAEIEAALAELMRPLPSKFS